MAGPFIEATGLSKAYRTGATPVQAVRDVSFTIEKGEFVAIVGRSGSGKSSLMSLLGLLERADAGRYQLGGQDISSLSDDARARLRCRTVGFVFQLPSLLARATALENVEMPMAYAGLGLTRPERHERAREALERVGLTQRKDHWPNQLSGGEQQRVAIARALINDPALILADEPTGALDTRTAEEILALFETMNASGRTVIVVTHAADIAGRTRRQIRLSDGRMIENKVSVVHPPAYDNANGPAL